MSRAGACSRRDLHWLVKIRLTIGRYAKICLPVSKGMFHRRCNIPGGTKAPPYNQNETACQIPICRTVCGFIFMWIPMKPYHYYQDNSKMKSNLRCGIIILLMWNWTHINTTLKKDGRRRLLLHLYAFFTQNINFAIPLTTQFSCAMMQEIIWKKGVSLMLNMVKFANEYGRSLAPCTHQD